MKYFLPTLLIILLIWCSNLYGQEKTIKASYEKTKIDYLNAESNSKSSKKGLVPRVELKFVSDKKIMIGARFIKVKSTLNLEKSNFKGIEIREVNDPSKVILYDKKKSVLCAITKQGDTLYRKVKLRKPCDIDYANNCVFKTNNQNILINFDESLPRTITPFPLFKGKHPGIRRVNFGKTNIELTDWKFVDKELDYQKFI